MTKEEERNATQVRTKEQSRPGNRIKTGPYFVDENGDGINDFYRTMIMTGFLIVRIQTNSS